MYKVVEPEEHVMIKGANNEFSDEGPALVSLKDEYGCVAHILKDDGCYVLVQQIIAGTVHKECRMVKWWFPEAAWALVDYLSNPLYPYQRRHEDGVLEEVEVETNHSRRILCELERWYDSPGFPNGWVIRSLSEDGGSPNLSEEDLHVHRGTILVLTERWITEHNVEIPDDMDFLRVEIGLTDRVRILDAYSHHGVIACGPKIPFDFILIKMFGKWVVEYLSHEALDHEPLPNLVMNWLHEHNRKIPEDLDFLHVDAEVDGCTKILEVQPCHTEHCDRRWKEKLVYPTIPSPDEVQLKRGTVLKDKASLSLQLSRPWTGREQQEGRLLSLKGFESSVASIIRECENKGWLCERVSTPLGSFKGDRLRVRMNTPAPSSISTVIIGTVISLSPVGTSLKCYFFEDVNGTRKPVLRIAPTSTGQKLMLRKSGYDSLIAQAYTITVDGELAWGRLNPTYASRLDPSITIQTIVLDADDDSWETGDVVVSVELITKGERK